MRERGPRGWRVRHKRALKSAIAILRPSLSECSSATKENKGFRPLEPFRIDEGSTTGIQPFSSRCPRSILAEVLQMFCIRCEMTMDHPSGQLEQREELSLAVLFTLILAVGWTLLRRGSRTIGQFEINQQTESEEPPIWAESGGVRRSSAASHALEPIISTRKMAVFGETASPLTRQVHEPTWYYRQGDHCVCISTLRD